MSNKRWQQCCSARQIQPWIDTCVCKCPAQAYCSSAKPHSKLIHYTSSRCNQTHKKTLLSHLQPTAPAANSPTAHQQHHQQQQLHPRPRGSCTFHRWVTAYMACQIHQTPAVISSCCSSCNPLQNHQAHRLNTQPAHYRWEHQL